MRKFYLLITMITFIAINYNYANGMGDLLNDFSSSSKVLAVDFTVSDTLTCSGTVQFTDLSGNGATAWVWYFGDGNSSTVQNPIHTYNASGSFTVTLITVGTAGIDSLVKPNYVTVAFLSAPIVSTDTTICQYNPVTLNATPTGVGGGLVAWFDSLAGGNLLDTGTTFTSAPLVASTTFYAVTQQLSASLYGGPVDSSLGGGGFYPNPGNRIMYFDCNIACRLVSVKVYANGGGPRTIFLNDSSGNQLYSVTATVPDGESRVYLNWDIQPGTNYEIGNPGNSNFYRNNAGAVYPYDINGLLSITGNDGGGPTFYYFFYDWQVSYPPCVSPRVPINVTVTPGPQASFNYTQNLSVFNCTDLSVGATSWSWDFGDGSAPVITQNANHTYATPGSYVITLTAGNGTCSSTMSVTVNATAFNFTVNDTLTCNGIVQFTDLSNNGSTAWVWHFGDGGSSTLHNPTHTYASAGYFTVTFISVSGSGIDSLVKTNYIHVALLTAPTVSPDTTICQFNSVTLTATGSGGQIAWFDSIVGGNQLDTGATFTSGLLVGNTTFYAASLQASPSVYGGPADSSLGGGGFYNVNGNRTMIFDCDTSCRLVSVLVYAQGAGPRTIFLNDNNGNQLNSVNVNVPDGASRIYLNFDLQPGTGYELGNPGMSLFYRNNTGATYPYDINGWVTITGNNAGGMAANYYYFFYDWEVSTGPLPCVSPRVPINVTVTPGPQASFVFSQNLNVFNCTDLSTGGGGPITTWSWDFGDGSAPVITQNASHTYTTSGTYVITLTAGNGTCSSSMSVTVNATFAGISENYLSQVSLQPNPVKDVLNINLPVFKGNLNLSVMNNLGQVVYTSKITKVNHNTVSINLSSLARSVYVLKLESDDAMILKKIIKE